MNILELSEQEIVRREALAELRNMGIEPYPAAEYPTNAFSTDILAEFKDEDEPREVCIAGRMMSRRVMGKASFIELQDSKGRIQVYITRDDICPGENKDGYNVLFKRLLDIGDFVGIKGTVFRTQTGEITVHAKEITFLSKSIRPLPIVKYKDGVAYDKFEDPELRYRQRYVDLVVNDDVKEIFIKRNKIYSSMRASLSITNSRSSRKLMSIKSMMPSSHLILCRPFLLLPLIPPSIRVFSNESTLCIRWPKYWSFSFSIRPSNEHPRLISFRMDWLDLLAVQGTLKSLLQHHSSKGSILRCSAFL